MALTPESHRLEGRASGKARPVCLQVWMCLASKGAATICSSILQHRYVDSESAQFLEKSVRWGFAGCFRTIAFWNCSYV
jgi:hypothetical protein